MHPGARVRGYAAFLLGILAVGAGVRATVLLDAKRFILLRVPILDGAYYHESARGILDGSWPGSEPYFMGPLYSYFLAGLYALFGADVLVARVAQVVLGLCLAGGVAAVARSLAGERVALPAAALAALFGPCVFYEQLLLLEIALALALVLLLWRAIRCAEQPRLFDAALVGAFAAAATAFRGTSLLYLVPVAFLWGRRLVVSRHGALALAVCVAFLAPFTLHNRSAGSSALLTTNLGWNAFIGNRPGANGMFAYPNGWRAESDPTGTAFASQLAGRPLSPDETNAFWLRLARRAVTHDPLAFAVNLARKAYLFVQPEEIPQNESFGFFQEQVPPVTAAFVRWWMLVPLALAGIVLAGGRARWAPLSFALVPLLVAVAFFVTGRYRVAAVPFLAVLGGMGAVGLFDLARASLRRFAFAASIVAAFAVALLALPAPYDQARARARDHEHLGLRYQREGANRAAEEQYRKAIAIRPDDPDAWNNLGTLLQESGRLPEAARAFEEAARAQPKNPVPWRNLAFVRGRMGDPAGAEVALRRALEPDPGHVETLVNLGTALALQSRFAEAIEVYDEVLRLDPVHARAREMLESAREFLDAGGG